MTSHSGPTPPELGPYLRDHLEYVESANEKVLEEAATLLHDVILRDGLIFTSGSGHSTAMVLETFYRAGGLACVSPVSHPGLFPLEGGLVSTLVERTEGLAKLLVDRASPTSADAAVIFSNSGTNAFPVELAKMYGARDVPVIAFVSVPHMTEAPQKAGVKLGDISTIVVDTRVPYGDAVLRTGEQNSVALSSLTTIYLWNLLLGRLVERADASGTELPIWTSANTEGGDERNAKLLDRYRDRVPYIC